MQQFAHGILLGCSIICGALVGCSKPSTNESAPVASSSAVPPSVDSSRSPTAPAAENPRDFGSLFRTESENRPSGTIKAEDAIATFEKDGIRLDKVRQHLGRPYGARYCVGGMAGTAIAVSVCEYIDAKAAEAGAEASRKIVLANREIRINQATSLTVREVEKTPEADAVAQKLFASFAKLKS
jgi:hypothetical protein